MKCAKAQELFSSYLENTIQPPMGVALEQHLAECSHCKAKYDGFHATALVLDELPEVEPPPDMRAVIMARIEQQRREAPRTRWLHFDWQSVFTVRVPAKALAMGAAMLVVAGMLVQLTPLHTMTASILGGQRASQAALDEDPGFAPGPMPSGLGTDRNTKFADVGARLMIGVRVDPNKSGSTVYTIKLATRAQRAVPVQVYLLAAESVKNSIDASEMTNQLYSGAVTNKGYLAVPVVQTSGSMRTAEVAMVTWNGDGESHSELIFLPSSFGKGEGSQIAANQSGVCDILSRLSAEQGAVIMAPGKLAAETSSVSVAGSGEQAIADAMKQAGLTWQPLGTSTYEVK